MGIIVPGTAKAIEILDGLKKELLAGRINSDEFDAAVVRLDKDIAAMQGKDVTVTVHTVYDGTPYGGGGSGGGSGGPVTDPNTGSTYGETPEQMAARLAREAAEREARRKYSTGGSGNAETEAEKAAREAAEAARRLHSAGYAGGANFVVPAGYPNDSYPINVQSGERVIVIPADKSSSDPRGLPAMTVNIYNSMDLESFKRMLMEAMR
jgi:hypothetical protein